MEGGTPFPSFKALEIGTGRKAPWNPNSKKTRKLTGRPEQIAMFHEQSVLKQEREPEGIGLEHWSNVWANHGPASLRKMVIPDNA